MNVRDTGKALRMGLIGLIVVALIAAAIVSRSASHHPAVVTNLPVTLPATAPSTKAATHTATPEPDDLLGLLRASDPQYPTTQELDVPGNYDQAAHVVLKQHLYLCPAGHVWITDPRGTSIERVLSDLGSGNTPGNTHVVRDKIAFVHWQLADRKWIASAVRQNPGGGFDLVQAHRTTPLSNQRKWQWDRALTWEDKIIVPTDRGVSVLSVNDPAHDSYEALVDEQADASTLSSPVVLFDTHGILAWMPWDAGKTGSVGAARFADGKWTRLDASQNWPEKILQLVPLLDGSVVQLIPGDQGTVSLAISGTARDASNLNEAEIEQWVQKLSDADQVNRDAAYEQLTRYGPGIFPILQKLQESQSPAAQSRIAELLQTKLNLTLGPITLQPGPVTTVQRLRDGGVVLYCDAGVSVARGSADKPTLVAPAWLSIRPGYAVQVLPTRLTDDLTPGKQHFWAFKSEWILGDDTQGLRWFVGNYLSPLEHKDEYRFNDFVGIDSRGRWIMREAKSDGATLIVDPNLPDTTPRLPVWVYTQKEGSAGWTNTNWPAVKPQGVVVLGVDAWRDPTKDEVFYEHQADMPASAPSTAPAAAAPATAATTLASTDPATTQDADLLLVDSDGTRYYDGSSTLRIKTPDGRRLSWDLPASAVGTGDVWLFHTAGRFFLFNEPGRVIRLRRTPDAPEPFALEQIFTRNIPNVDNQNTWIDRIWLDPAGRIVIACNTNTLAILFPSGQVPADIRQMMPAEKSD